MAYFDTGRATNGVTEAINGLIEFLATEVLPVIRRETAQGCQEWQTVRSPGSPLPVRRPDNEGTVIPTLTVIIASTRPGRAGLAIAEWFTGQARALGTFQVVVADLAELDLPLMDEPNHPRLRQYLNQHTKDWSAVIDASDAFVIVTPEYNYGYPAPIKNAIDYLHEEWKDKPVGFVSYGGVAAGTRAVQQLKQVVTTLKMLPVVEALNIPFHTQFIDEEGRVQANEVMEQAAAAMLDELLRTETALRPLRDHAEVPGRST